LKRHPDVCDKVFSPEPDFTPWKLQGFRFDTPNPYAGLFAGDLSVTGPFQPFGASNESRIRPSEQPNSAIYSVSTDGGPVKIEAYGLHNPRGITFDEYGRLYLDNRGMELRGTRPVFDDPDALLRITLSPGSSGSWFGSPDYTTDGHPVSDERYSPPVSMLIQSGYRELSTLVNQEESGLHLPDFGVILQGDFPSLSGAEKLDFIPGNSPFKDFSGDAIIALSGDQSPFATSGLKLLGRVGFKVVRVNSDKQVKDLVRNTAGVPISMQPFGTVGLERPYDVKVGPDGAIYILDFGRMDNNNAIPRYYPGTGGLFKLTSEDAESATTDK
jgi:hypothetical protein